MAFLGNEEQIRELQDRFRFVYFAVFAAIGIIVSRLVYLQILNGDKMRQYSEENRIKKVKIAAPRGMIYDRNRTLLVDNRPSFDVEVTPQYLKESKQKDEVLQRLGSLVGMTQAQLLKKLEKNQASFLAIKVKENLSRDEVAQLETWKLDMPGIGVTMEISRTNLFGDVASHLLGYISQINPKELKILNRDSKTPYQLDDYAGKDGIEKKHEELLRGKDGQELVEVDALGRMIKQAKRGRMLAENPEEPAIPGKNLILTIDQDLQLEAAKAFGEKAGGVVAIDPRNGEILTLISRPSFNPTDFSRGIDPKLWKDLISNEDRPLRDKTMQDHYPPGSTFKIITAIAGLEEGVVDENSTVHCTGAIQVGNRQYHCHKKGGHGTVNMVQAIAMSCDTYFYRLSQKLKSVDDIAKWAKHLGLGSRTGIPLSREAPGIIPTEAWKMKNFNQPWTGGETLSVAIGQSFVTTTVLQLANSYAAIINGGTLFRPHFLKAVESPEGQLLEEYKAVVMGQTQIQEKNIALIKHGLWGVVNSTSGTAQGQRIPGMEYSGKTGTSQVVSEKADKIYNKCENKPYRQRHHGLFVGYAPVDNPSIVVAVVAEHSCHGGSGAGPIAKAIFKKYLEKYYPDKYSEKVMAEKLRKKIGLGPFPLGQGPIKVIEVGEGDE